MFKDKVVILSGDNREFNNRFLKRFYEKVKEVKLLTSNIFDKSYDEYEKITLVSNIEDISKSLNNSDILLHYVTDELTNLKNTVCVHDEFTFNSEKLLQTAIKSSIAKFVFISDAKTSVANDRMMKNMAVKYSARSKSCSINYLLLKDASVDEMIDGVIFAIKSMNNGEIFVKKVQEKRTFSSRLKELFSSKTKIQKARESFFNSEEFARMVDYGKYYKIAADDENYKLNIFSERLKSLESAKDERALESV